MNGGTSYFLNIEQYILSQFEWRVGALSVSLIFFVQDMTFYIVHFLHISWIIMEEVYE